MKFQSKLIIHQHHTVILVVHICWWR